MNETRVYILASIHGVLKAEQILERAAVPFELIPVPKEVNPDCGLAIEVSLENADAARRAVEQAGLTVEQTYIRRGSEFTPSS